jgi:hypothetical protein
VNIQHDHQSFGQNKSNSMGRHKKKKKRIFIVRSAYHMANELFLAKKRRVLHCRTKREDVAGNMEAKMPKNDTFISLEGL